MNKNKFKDLPTYGELFHENSELKTMLKDISDKLLSLEIRCRAIKNELKERSKLNERSSL